MAIKAERAKRELINKVAARVRKGLRGRRADHAVCFVQQLYAYVPPDDLLEEKPEQLAGAAAALLGYVQVRPADRAKIRVFTPESESHGWTSSHTVIEIVNDDMPFLVDSVTAQMEHYEGHVLLVIHPIVDVKRDKNGRLTAIHPAGEGPEDAARESVMQVHITEQPPELLDQIRVDLDIVLADVRASVEDWRTMRQRCRELIVELESTPPRLAPREIAQGIEFLKWLDDDHFTYLGYREYSFKGKGGAATARIHKDSGLGVLRDESVSVFDGLRKLGKLPEDVRDFLQQPELLRISKSNRRTTVHRPVHMDTISVKTFDKKGNVTGERLFVGLFTSVAYTRSPRQIPLLREKVEEVITRSGFAPASHDGKALAHILETYPRDELFQMSDEELAETAMGVLHLQERQRLALFVRRDPFDRFVSAMVYVPRDRFDTRLRLKLQEMLTETFNGHIDAYATHVSESPLARLHVTLATRRGEIPSVDLAALEAQLVDAARSWTDRLEQALMTIEGERRGRKKANRYTSAFPLSYQEAFTEAEAVSDIACIEAALESGDLAMDLYRPAGAPGHVLHFKTFVLDHPVPLSDILPMLENMGLKVIGEVPFKVRCGEDRRKVWIHDFGMETVGRVGIALDQVREAFHDAFHRVWRGAMEDDGFNKLVLHAGLTAREVIVLRAYSRYLRQAAIPFSHDYMEETLAKNAKLSRYLVDLFLSRFDPAEGDEGRARRLKIRIEQLLEEVSNLDEDRIIRRFLNAIESTLRTNFFQAAQGGGEKSYVSMKFDSRNLEELPLPRPFREIFVYSPRTEGVHLRFGMVARGGLRWSDRREDFRTEILGLVKAQQVKNAVIVPVGSKGGFVVKRPPPADAGRDAFQAEGIACYKTFISGLLDLTDNLKGNKVIPPKQVVRRDGDDPYLVVAADKGTATFSDIANGVSIEYGHWLDDAFASGGSAGYDHKKMGITARGAWESVKRHFREIGKDTQSEDFTCIGCGDMSGDVFGNGMLLSKHIKLVGAFNHLHIFVDPNPDPAASWTERNRMFNLPRSTWTDYEEKLISKGGGIFDRKAKSIDVTQEMKRLFGISKEKMTPNELITAMLKSEVELLWFGGIGTYIKASHETHLDAGDRANDAIRIDATQLKAKVVGEGANLGMTQRARIEYGMLGGRVNTDSIDNSAGVDCSDHEVNIKILLGAIEQSGKLTRKQRDKLLERMTDEVADLVLRDNYLQTQAITVTHHLGAHLLDRLARFMRGLERAGLLDRAIEFLPDDETVMERQKQGIGMSRPELSVLLSYAKIVLYDELLDSDLPDDPSVAHYLVEYFPTPLRKKYAQAITRHRLRREIVATAITNEIVNRMGPAFIHEVREKTGMPSAEIARAYLVASEIFSIRSIWHEIEMLDNKVPASLQADMLIECGRLVERETVWFLRECSQPLDVGAMVKGFGKGVGYLMDNLEGLLFDQDSNDLTARSLGYRDLGAPGALAQRVASLAILSPACDIVRIAEGAKISVAQVGQAYFAIGARFGFDWLRRAAGRLPSDTAWDKLAITAIIDDLFGHQSELTARVLDVSNGAAADSVIDTWAEARRPVVQRTAQLLQELQSTGTPDFAMLAVANRQLKSMVAGG